MASQLKHRHVTDRLSARGLTGIGGAILSLSLLHFSPTHAVSITFNERSDLRIDFSVEWDATHSQEPEGVTWGELRLLREPVSYFFISVYAGFQDDFVVAVRRDTRAVTLSGFEGARQIVLPDGNGARFIYEQTPGGTGNGEAGEVPDASGGAALPLATLVVLGAVASRRRKRQPAPRSV